MGVPLRGRQRFRLPWPPAHRRVGRQGGEPVQQGACAGPDVPILCLCSIDYWPRVRRIYAIRRADQGETVSAQSPLVVRDRAGAPISASRDGLSGSWGNAHSKTLASVRPDSRRGLSRTVCRGVRVSCGELAFDGLEAAASGQDRTCESSYPNRRGPNPRAQPGRR
jgi:hypothetical protein